MDFKKMMPMLVLGILGFLLAAWGVYVIAADYNGNSIWEFKSQIVFIITGILLIIFAAYYAKNGDLYSEAPEGNEDEVEIIWEEDPDINSETNPETDWEDESEINLIDKAEEKK